LRRSILFASPRSRQHRGVAERERPKGLLRFLFRVPPLLYRLGLAGPAGRTMLLLVTRGRRSGKRRYSGLNYAEDGATVYVMSGYGPRTDWYRNLVADPRVEVRIGRRRWRAVAKTVTEPALRGHGIALLLETAQRQGPPRRLRPLFARLGLDYDAELASFDRDAANMPLVALTPH
jgi:deazaflavin-dependent oxidoreductase (nitroreductase family)